MIMQCSAFEKQGHIMHMELKLISHFISEQMAQPKSKQSTFLVTRRCHRRSRHKQYDPVLDYCMYHIRHNIQRGSKGKRFLGRSKVFLYCPECVA